MLLANQIAEFLNQLYFKLELKNQFGFWHTNIDPRNLNL